MIDFLYLLQNIKKRFISKDMSRNQCQNFVADFAHGLANAIEDLQERRRQTVPDQRQ